MLCKGSYKHLQDAILFVYLLCIISWVSLEKEFGRTKQVNNYGETKDVFYFMDLAFVTGKITYKALTI